MPRPTLDRCRLSLLLALAACSCSKSEAAKPPPPAAPAQSAGTAAPAKAAETAAAEPEKPFEDPPFSKVEGERGLRVREAGAFDGYTLLAPLRSKSIHLIDMDGKVVHTWATDHVPGVATYFLPNGHLLRGAMVDGNPRFHGGGIGGRIEELDWDGKVVWSYELASDKLTLHHDFTRMPNGHLLAIAWEYHAPEEVFERGRAQEQIHEEGLWSDVVLELEPTQPSGAKVVWTWRAWDHLVQDERKGAAGYGDPAAFPGRFDINADHRFDVPESDAERKQREERELAMQSLGYAGGKPADANAPRPDAAPQKKDSKHDADWLHSNAIDYLPEEDLIAMSSPHLSEIWVLDHGTTTAEAAGSSGGRRGHGGELLYRWGNARNYGMGDAETRTLYAQHNVTWQRGSKPGEYSLLIYDNGDKRPPSEFSEVVEIALPFETARGFLREEGWAFGPKEPAWSYKEPGKLFSPFISGAQRLPNGNTLVCEGTRGRVLEVTRAGAIVWDFYNPLGGEIEPSKQGGKAPSKALFRATRIAKNDPALAGKL